MHSKYIELFKELAQTTAITAEQVMDYNHTKDDRQGFDTAMMMRDDYQDIHDRITEAGANYELNRSDAAKLLVGSMIVINQLQDKINALRTAITGYQGDVIPKLQDIVDNAKSDAAAIQMANEKFIIEDNK